VARKWFRGILAVIAMVLALWAGAAIGQTASMSTTSPLISPMVYLPMVIGGGGTPTPETIALRGVGVIWQYMDPETVCDDLALLGVEQYQNWLPYPPTCPGIEPVCMWWGIGSHLLDTNPDCDTIFLWNEPQFTTQSNIEPQTGADTWDEIVQTANGRKITTPCADLSWLSTWANTYHSSHGEWPEFDYTCIHSYPYIMPRYPLSPVEQTINLVESARSWSLSHDGDGKIWLHEFGLWPAWCPGETCVEEYIAEIIPWLEEHGVPYNWFALSHVGEYMAPSYDTSLVLNGELTPFGEAYDITD